MSRHVRESRHVRVYVVEDTPRRLVFRLEPGPHETWQALFEEALEGENVEDAAAVRFDQYLVYAEKDPGSPATERARSEHITRDIVRLVAETTAAYRSLQDNPADR